MNIREVYDLSQIKVTLETKRYDSNGCRTGGGLNKLGFVTLPFG
ncbi:hypothetical protein [Paenibacillus sp. TY11]